jgi:hypothetical protein
MGPFARCSLPLKLKNQKGLPRNAVIANTTTTIIIDDKDP